MNVSSDGILVTTAVPSGIYSVKFCSIGSKSAGRVTGVMLMSDILNDEEEYAQIRKTWTSMNEMYCREDF